jgi:hypothetical protein
VVADAGFRPKEIRVLASDSKETATSAEAPCLILPFAISHRQPPHSHLPVRSQLLQPSHTTATAKLQMTDNHMLHHFFHRPQRRLVYLQHALLTMHKAQVFASRVFAFG